MDFFKDAGYKLKSVVNAIFIVSIILHCIAAIVLLFVAISNEAFLSFLLGILILAISLFFSWLALLATAAFADLAIDASDAAANIADMKFYLQHFAKPAANTGKHVLHFKHKCSPYEIYEGKYYGKDIDKLELELYRGQTLTFCVNDCINEGLSK